MGIETEYGIVQPGRPTANPMLLSSHVVAAYTALSTPQAGHARWDYADEDPLADARGPRLRSPSGRARPGAYSAPCRRRRRGWTGASGWLCLLYTSDAADEEDSVD